MSDPKNQQDQTSPESRMAESRRRLVQAGLASAPLFLVLKSTPVLATNCKNPSGFSVSGNLSRPEDFAPCAFLGPSGWQGIPLSGWPAAAKQGANQTYKLSEVLGSTTYSGISNANTIRILQALGSGDAFVSYIAAAYLNSVGPSSGAFPATTDQIGLMWQNGPTGSGYLPAPTYDDAWGTGDIVAYLQYLMS